MYEAITANRRRTWVLLALVGSLVTALAYLFGLSQGLDWSTSLIIGFSVAAIHGLISYQFGDKFALSSSGAVAIKKVDHPEVFRLVENLTLANGQPLPKIYLINDPSPNAFATGKSPETASIAITTGLITLLSKTELEGVIAHELSHIKNYDIRVMTVGVVLVGAIAFFADLIFRSQIFGHRGGGGEKNNSQVIWLVVGLVAAIIAPIIAKLIQLAISRQREYLADASAALLTRYPDGLASALEKISAINTPLARANHATAHLFISSPFGASKFQNLFSTHPPAAQRIARLRALLTE